MNTQTNDDERYLLFAGILMWAVIIIVAWAVLVYAQYLNDTVLITSSVILIILNLYILKDSRCKR